MKAQRANLHTQSVNIIASKPAHSVMDFVCGALTDGGEFAHSRDLEVSGNDALAAEALMRDLTVELIWHYADGLALHAAAVSVHGCVILFPAISGSGKSTLSVYLAKRGLCFLTDELVFIPTGKALVHPLTRPAHLKPGSVFLLSDDKGIDNARVWRYPQGALISPSAFSSHSNAPEKLGAIVFPAYQKNTATVCTGLSAGAASFALMGSLLNARNLPESGVPELTRVASSVPAFRLSYDNLDEAFDALVDIARRQTR